MKRPIIAILFFTLFISVNDQINAKIRKAPNFALFNLKGKLRTLTSLQKNHLVLSFWASYCKSCKREMSHLVELEKKYKRIKDIKLILINIDRDGKEKAQPILNQLGIRNECLLDIYQITAKKYISNLRVPAIFLLNKKKQIVFKTIGENEKILLNLEKAIINLP